MSNSNFFSKFLKNINNSINNLLEKNLNKLNLNNLLNIARSNKIFLTIVALVILFVSYLSIPNIYKQEEITLKFNSQLSEKFNLNLNFSENFEYSFFPRPHFIIKDTEIKIDQKIISKVKKLKIYVSLENLFSLRNMRINELIIENANFNLDKNNYKFLFDLLDNDFKEKSLKIKNSNIFFRNLENEVLFVNKIINMQYYYDTNDLQNIIISENEIFNIPYVLQITDNKDRNQLLSELSLNFLKLQIQNQFNYNKKIKDGIANFILNKTKSSIKYNLYKNSFDFNYFDKIESPNFFYQGVFNFKPFFSKITGKSNKLNLDYYLDSNGFVVQLLKTEIFNNKNINFEFNIKAKKIQGNNNFENINLISKINEGLIDIDNTKFSWKKYVDFQIQDSLIFLKKGKLTLDGRLKINILDYEELYKFLLTPKNYRNKIKTIDLNFTYDFDQKSAVLNDIRVDGKFNQNLNKVMSNINFKRDNLQNKIYLKKLLNDAIKNYAG